MMRTEATRTARAKFMPVLDLGRNFQDLLDADDYPCVGAKAGLSQGAIETHEFGPLGDRSNDRLLADGLAGFVDMIDAAPADDFIVHSYVAIFRGPTDMTERRFEALLWSQLWHMHELDVLTGNHPAQDVSDDVASRHFSLSLSGHPFFVIGLHANASRFARRFSHPALVFNSHRQFEKLRKDGRFEKMQAATRARDVALQGSVNPNLADFGDASEARQYSGREVEADWKCPFDFRKPA